MGILLDKTKQISSKQRLCCRTGKLQILVPVIVVIWLQTSHLLSLCLRKIMCKRCNINNIYLMAVLWINTFEVFGWVPASCNDYLNLSFYFNKCNQSPFGGFFLSLLDWRSIIITFLSIHLYLNHLPEPNFSFSWWAKYPTENRIYIYIYICKNLYMYI